MVLPKRLRWFVHRRPELAGEASRTLAREIDRHYCRKLGPGAPVSARVNRVGLA